MERIRKDFTTLILVMIPVAIAINIAVGTIIYNLKVPLYLDSIGTVLVGVLAGPWAGALTGLLSNLIWGLSGINPQYTPFASTAAVIGMLAGLFSEAGWMRTWWKVILAGVITGLVAAVLSAPISAYVFGGVTGSGTDLVTAFFSNMGFGILPASFAQGVSSDPLDKAITYLIVWLIVVALPLRFLARFPRAENVQSAAPSVMGAEAGSSTAASRAGTKPLVSKTVSSSTATAKAGAKGTATKSAAKKPAAKKTAAKKPAARKR
jgi:energy-coupling factor transport system substrate-specific component